MDILNSLTSIDSIVKYVESSSIDNIIQEVSKLHNISIDELCNLKIEGYSKENLPNSYYVVLMDIKENIYKYEWLYHKLSDINSKRSLLNLLRYRLTTDTIFIKYEIDKDIIYTYEDKKKKISDLKIDIKFKEINEIIGAKNYIKDGSYKLEICLCNSLSDLWKLPELINFINNNYEFYIKNQKKFLKWETILYAIPKTKNSNYENKRKGFYLVPFAEDLIRNVILTKDVGLIPYFMHKKIGYESILIAGKDENRPYLEKYVSGLKIEVINSQLSFDEGIYNYIASNYERMDVLMLIGIYETYFNKLKFYKKLRPDGKVYLKLDANSFWMNRIDFNNKDIMEFLNNIDVISVESKALKKYLSTKIPYKKIEYIPNSYLNYSNDSNINYKDKENIIITVGRIGTVQKNNEVLLEAFSLTAEKIPDWKLKLIGDIDANFNKYIDAYFYRNPNLINRVIFIGNIESKEDLFEEYKKVKIFTLTSIREGLPNVYSEAALNGNYIITSNIDACMDMTNNLKYYTNEVKNSLMDLMFEIMEDREESEIFRNDLLNNTRIWYDAIEIEFS